MAFLSDVLKIKTKIQIKIIINLFSLGCMLCIASYFLPWLKYNEDISWAGYNIVWLNRCMILKYSKIKV